MSNNNNKKKHFHLAASVFSGGGGASPMTNGSMGLLARAKHQREGFSKTQILRMCMFLSLFPVLIFLFVAKSRATGMSRGKASLPRLKPSSCGIQEYCDQGSSTNVNLQASDISNSDAILSVDLLNNWHWCPSALARMRQLDGPVNEFLAQARKRGALIVHAVSDSKPHYLSEVGIAKAARTVADHQVPEPGRVWGAVSKPLLRSFDPPNTLSLDRACGEEGRSLFGSRKPVGMPGLNASNLDASYDIVAVDKDVIYSAILNHAVPVKRILFVGVHLDLCILYTRWFSIFRVAKFWQLEQVKEFGLVTNLLDASTYGSNDYRTEMQRNLTAVKRLACWISCQAGPQFLAKQDTMAGATSVPVNVYEYA